MSAHVPKTRMDLRAIALSPVGIAVAISITVTTLNGITKAIIQARRPVVQDFFLGIGLVLGATGTNLTNLVRSLATEGPRPPMAFAQAMLIGPLLMMLVFSIALQQESERRLADGRSPGWSAWAANALGFVAMAVAVRLGVVG